MNRDTITIVSGLPRSGTSMMMKMLVAGGIEALTDNIRTADEDNPTGYFEFEKAKELERDASWLEEAKGRVVKIVSALLKHLPQDHSYKIIFMRRKMEEILASQNQMLIRRGEPPGTVSDARMAEMFEKHLRAVEVWLASQPNIEVIYVSYSDAVENPPACADRINRFLGGYLDTQKIAAAVDRSLHRQQR